jgi:non-specific serine/threonine protein kinase
VAALIARGYTNRRIAGALVVVEATAERHVANIMAKLGAHARTEIAAWAAGHLPAEDAAVG